MSTLIMIIGGLAVLTLGADLLVRGAVRVAEALGVSPLLIGLTIVGFGTSTPELVTSVKGALIGSPGIAVGNIVGSNIFNVLVILGIAALIRPLAVAPVMLRRDGLVVVATALLLCLVGYAWSLDRPTGAAFLALLAGYLYAAWRQESGGADGHTAAFEKGEALEGFDPATRPDGPRRSGILASVALALAGIALLVLGGSLFVDGSVGLARGLGIDEAVIGLTIVAAGTSMPELATSAVAALRRQGDVALGNVLGSNIYNVLGIGGVTALVAPTPVPPAIVAFDNPVMLGISLLLVALMYTGRRLSRAEGGLLLAGYAVYLWTIWPV